MISFSLEYFFQFKPTILEFRSVRKAFTTDPEYPDSPDPIVRGQNDTLLLLTEFCSIFLKTLTVDIIFDRAFQ